MPHLETKSHVEIEVLSTDSSLLDEIQNKSPSEDEEGVLTVYGGVHRIDESDIREEDRHKISVLVAFEDILKEDGTVKTSGESQADDLYTEIKNLSYGSDDSYSIRQYVSPVGGVRTETVKDYYEENPEEKPVDDEGEAYTPSSFRPENHVVKETSK
jgi:hypothetical protein